MRRKIRVFTLATCLPMALLAMGARFLWAKAPGPTSTALTGHVSSSKDGPMEGVLVSARKEGSTFTVTVVSDKDGTYSFPRTNLGPGSYQLHIRAIGYELDDPGTLKVSTQKTTAVNLKLHELADISHQMTTQEWLQSVPGTQEQKMELAGCGGCHTLQRVLTSHHTADEFMSIFERMSSYYVEVNGYRPEKSGQPSRFSPNEKVKQRAEYFSSLNLSKMEKYNYELKSLPRPTGRSTHVIYTEYDLLGKDRAPHDVAVDHDGNVWYTDSGWEKIGKLDPKTGKVTEYSIQQFKPDEPVGPVDLEIDKDGNLWPGLNEQNQVAKFDIKTAEFKYWDPTTSGLKSTPFVMPYHDDVDRKVWITDLASIGRMDLKSGEFERFDVFKNVPGGPRGHLVYQIMADSQNNCFFLDWPGGGVGEVDAKTGEVFFYPTPTRNSFSRRGHIDSQERFWFAEFYADQIGMFDTKTRTFKEWPVPDKWTFPYEANIDKNGYVWTSGHNSDRLQRLDPKTGEVIQYLLPRSTDARKIDFQDSRDGLVLWMPNKSEGSIVRVQVTE